MTGRLLEARPILAAAVTQARAAGDPTILREALGFEGSLAALVGEPDAGERLRAAVRLPGLADTRDPYCSPEMFLAFWHLWRGEVSAARDRDRIVVTAAVDDDAILARSASPVSDVTVASAPSSMMRKAQRESLSVPGSFV